MITKNARVAQGLSKKTANNIDGKNGDTKSKNEGL